MSTIAFVNRMAAQGVQLWLDNGKLQYQAPRDLVTPDLLGELRQHKEAIISLLQEYARSTGTYPLSYSQKSLWSLHQLNPRSAAYNVTYATQVIDDLDSATLNLCLDYLVARHPILRTRYVIIDDEPMQQVDISANLQLDVQHTQNASRQDILRWVDREANQPFDLAQSPFRMKLLVNASESPAQDQPPIRHVLLVNVHHVAADFWSLEILLRELAALYGQACSGAPLQLPPLPLQYKDYVAQEQQRLQGPEGQALAAFWTSTLQGPLPVLELPADNLRPPLKSENGRVLEYPLGAAHTDRIRQAARAAAVTPYMFLLALYQLFLYRHSGQPRILVGAPTAGRYLAGSETLLGHFVNTSVLDCELQPDLEFAGLLQRTRNLVLQVMEHQDYPFPLLVENLRPPRDPSRSPVFQVMFNWNQAHRDSSADNGLFLQRLAASSTGTRGATHDLTLNIYDQGSEFVCAWTYNSDLFQDASIARFARQFERLLLQVLQNPSLLLARAMLVEARADADAWLAPLPAAPLSPDPEPDPLPWHPRHPGLHLADNQLWYADVVRFLPTAAGWQLDTVRLPGLHPLILDRFDQPVEAGSEGVLHLLGSSEAVEESSAVIDEYVARVPTATLLAPLAALRTPLRARQLANGTLLLAGVTGHRALHQAAPFDLDQVEAVLAGVDGVAQVCCLERRINDRLQLVAWVQPAAGVDADPLDLRLRRLLRERLPEFMQPRHLLLMTQLPLDARGQPDIDSLPLPALTEEGPVAPRSPAEQILADIWCDVLSRDQISVHDNFFELGGDSILGAVIISRANLQGLYFSAREIFEHNSIAQLARIARTEPDIQAEQGLVTGPVPLTPVQHWFFEHVQADHSHFNQAILVQLKQVPDAALMQETLHQLARHHDVLRACFHQENGHWQQRLTDSVAGVQFAAVTCANAQQRQAAIAEAQASLDIGQGKLLQAVWLDQGDLQHSRLLLVVHHLVIDGLSWNLLLQDLSHIHSRLRAGETLQLPLKTSAYKDWSGHLEAFANSDSFAQDRHYWNQVARNSLMHQPDWNQLFRPSVTEQATHMDASGNWEKDSASLAIILDQDATAAFQNRVHRPYNTDANDLLLAALCLGFHSHFHSANLLVDVEGHGREPLFRDLDISRTLGWFTSIYPVQVQFDSHSDYGQVIKQIKQHLRSIPNRGMGFGLFKYLDRSVAELRPQLPRSPVLFTYIGALNQLAVTSDLLSGTLEPAPGIRSPRQQRSHLFDVVAYIRDGALTIDCTFNQRLFAETDISELMESVRSHLLNLLDHCLDPLAGGMTPSDVPDISISQQELDELLHELALLG